MGRVGRYTLSVMVWVAAFAGWSGLVGLVVGAVTGESASNRVPTGVSSLMYVVLPMVPTLVALWFNDWARDGFPSADERRRGSYSRADRTLRDRPRGRRTPDAAEPAAEAAAQAPADPADGTPVRSWADYAAGAGGTTVSVISTQPVPREAPAGDERPPA